MDRRDVQKDKKMKNAPKTKNKEKNKVPKKPQKDSVVPMVLSAPKGMKNSLKLSKRVLKILFTTIKKKYIPT